MRLNFLRGGDGQHFELQRMMGFVSCVAGIAYTGVHLYRDRIFNIIEFGTGMGMLILGIGGGVAVKAVGVAKANATKAASDVATETAA